MATAGLTNVPEADRDRAREAVATTFGLQAVETIVPVPGGASGARTFRVDAPSGPHLLRIEGPRTALRNPHQYECLRVAADAGVAPPVRFLDAERGIVILPFLEQRPLADFAGGPPALAEAAARLLSDLHHLPLFAAHGDYFENLAGTLGYLQSSGRVAPGLLDRHAEALRRIREAYPWHPEAFVSCHNDPNQFNVLYDGERLWLIDWETASRNDPMIDLATMAAHAAPTPALADILLRTWSGRPPDEGDRARLSLASRLISLFAGSVLLLIVPDPVTPVHTDLDAPTEEEFRDLVERGTLVPGEPATTLTFAKLMLGRFAAALDDPTFERELDLAGR